MKSEPRVEHPVPTWTNLLKSSFQLLSVVRANTHLGVYSANRKFAGGAILQQGCLKSVFSHNLIGENGVTYE